MQKKMQIKLSVERRARFEENFRVEDFRINCTNETWQLQMSFLSVDILHINGNR